MYLRSNEAQKPTYVSIPACAHCFRGVRRRWVSRGREEELLPFLFFWRNLLELLIALLQPVVETRTWRGIPSSPSSKHANPSPTAFKPTSPAFSSRRKPTPATPTRSPRRQAYLSSPSSPSLPPRRTMKARLFDVKRRFLAEVPALVVPF